MVNTPVPTTFATAPPEIVPNIPEATMAACAGPPLKFLIKLKEILINDNPAPVPSSMLPKRINGKTLKITIPAIIPRMPSFWLNHKSLAVVSMISTGAVSKIPGQY